MVVKLLFLITKKTGISQEEFESQYQPHIDKAVPILKKYGAVYYGMQWNRPAEQSAFVEAMGTLGLAGAAANDIVAKYDAVATIYFSDTNAMKQFLESKENREDLMPDSEDLAEKVLISVGIENAVLK